MVDQGQGFCYSVEMESQGIFEREIRGDKLKEAEIDWVLDELEDYAIMRGEKQASK